MGTAVQTNSYSYTDSNWKDKLTAFNGKTITYDAIGNPLSDGAWNYTWAQGRQMRGMYKGSFGASGYDEISFKYNQDGLRTQKTRMYYDEATGDIGYQATDYTLHGKNIVHLTSGSDALHFFYDAQNKPAVVLFNGTAYAYMYNLQGDVIALVDANGTKVVEYRYDAWGKPLSKTGTLAATLGTLNPFRYRGYVFDEETGLYYLRSRYYNPGWDRFINSDIILGIVGKIGSHNAYAYCLDSPISKYDPNGYEFADAYYFFQQASLSDGPMPYGDIIGILGGLGILLYGAIANAFTQPESKAKESAKEENRDNEPTYIYRYGGLTFRNLTPRETDEGLSFSLVPPANGRAFRTTLEAVNSTGILMAVNDHGTHVSVMPVVYSTMEEWKSTRETANENPHAYTVLLFSLAQ